MHLKQDRVQILHAEVCAFGFFSGMNQASLLDGMRAHRGDASNTNFTEMVVRLTLH